MSVIPLAVKRRVLEADARIDQLEKLLRTWVAYCDQSGEGKPFNDLNPVHVLLRDTREALKPAFLRQGMETAAGLVDPRGCCWSNGCRAPQMKGSLLCEEHYKALPPPMRGESV